MVAPFPEISKVYIFVTLFVFGCLQCDLESRGDGVSYLDTMRIMSSGSWVDGKEGISGTSWIGVGPYVTAR